MGKVLNSWICWCLTWWIEPHIIFSMATSGLRLCLLQMMWFWWFGGLPPLSWDWVTSDGRINVRVLFKSESKMQWETDRRIRAVAAVMGSLPGHGGEKGADPGGKALDLLVDLCSNPHLWTRAPDHDWKNETVDVSGRNEPPLRGGGA